MGSRNGKEKTTNPVRIPARVRASGVLRPWRNRTFRGTLRAGFCTALRDRFRWTRKRGRFSLILRAQPAFRVNLRLPSPGRRLQPVPAVHLSAHLHLNWLTVWRSAGRRASAPGRFAAPQAVPGGLQTAEATVALQPALATETSDSQAGAASLTYLTYQHATPWALRVSPAAAGVAESIFWNRLLERHQLQSLGWRATPLARPPAAPREASSGSATPGGRRQAAAPAASADGVPRVALQLGWLPGAPRGARGAALLTERVETHWRSMLACQTIRLLSREEARPSPAPMILGSRREASPPPGRPAPSAAVLSAAPHPCRHPVALQLAQPQKGQAEVAKTLKILEQRVAEAPRQPQAAPQQPVDIGQLTSRVYDELQRKLRVERERRGLI